MTDIETIRTLLHGKDIHIFTYCHADVAWVHSIRWHVNRYVAVFDEVLNLLKQHENFYWFIDSWYEFLKPCLEYRPEKIAEFRDMVKQKRIVVTAGQYCNLRLNQVGDETIIRNIIIGKRRVKEYFPEAELSVYANLDTAIGHSQVPQLLQLSNCPYYMVWRPQAGLDKQGIPKSFLWEGLSSHRILVTRLPYGPHLDLKFEATWTEVVDSLFSNFLTWSAQSPIKNIPMCLGRDDGLPLRDGNDASLDIFRVMQQWNEKETSHLKLSTPTAFFHDLEQEKHLLPVCAGELDIADVCYNAALMGQNGLWQLREFADRALIAAEIIAAIASGNGTGHYPEKELQQTWEQLLSICPHALQFLFAGDWRKIKAIGISCISRAEQIRENSLSELFPPCLPLDTDRILLLNILPHVRRAIVRVDIPISHLAYHSLSLTDGNGRPLVSQQVEDVARVEEPKYLVEVDIPPCGYRIINYKWKKDALEMALPVVREIADRIAIRSDCVEMVFRNGHLVEINDYSTGESFHAGEESGFLDPVALLLDGEEWFPKRLERELKEFQVDTFTVLEEGPLRWRIERRGSLGQCKFRQRISLLKGKSAIEVTTEYLAVPDGNSYYIGIGVPLPGKNTLRADIPFGIESRKVVQTPYGKLSDTEMFNLERQIPGIFYARSWVSSSSGLTLMTRDGDRYFYYSGASSLLAHILCRTMERAEKKWPQKTMLGQEIGWHKFHHVLRLHSLDDDTVRSAQEYKYPIISRFVAPDSCGERHSFLSLQPDSVRLSAFYREEESFILRLVQMAPQEVTAEIHLPFIPADVVMIDFDGNPLPETVAVSDNTLKVKLLPWQIGTLKFNRRID